MTLGQYLWWWRRGVWPWQARAYMQRHEAYLEQWLRRKAD